MTLTFPTHAVFRGQLSDEVAVVNSFAHGYAVELLPRRWHGHYMVSVTNGTVTGIPSDVASSLCTHFSKRLNITPGLIGIL